MLRSATTIFLCTTMLASNHVSADEGESRAFMSKVLARYREVNSYSHDSVNSFKIEFGNGLDNMMQAPPEVNTSFRYERPGRFALQSGQILDAYSDGSKLTAYAPDVGKYAHQEAGPDASLKNLPGMFGVFMPGEFPIASIVLEGPESFEHSAFKIESWGDLTEVAIDGRAGHQVSCSVASGMPGGPGGPSMDAVVWVDAKTGLIGRIEYDMLEQIKAMGPGDMGGPAPTVAKRVVEFNNVTRDEPIDADQLAFQPGEGDELVDSFPTVQEIMAAAFGGGFGDMEGSGDNGGIESDAGPEIGAPAPAFSAKTLDGKTVTLADLKGKAVLIDFWATWCGPCVQAMPTIQGLHEKYADKGLVVIGISLDDAHAAEKLGAFVKDNGVTFLQIHDTDSSIAKAFGVSPIPHSVLIGKDGTVQANHIGFMPGMDKQYAQEIEKLLKGESLTDG